MQFTSEIDMKTRMKTINAISAISSSVHQVEKGWELQNKFFFNT